MGYERRSFVLAKEPGVLPGSEFFISADKHKHLDTIQYLIMCGHYHCVRGYVIDRLFYDYIIIAYIANGKLAVKYDQREYVAVQGDVVIMDLRNPHYYAAVDSLEFLWIHVRGEVSERLYSMAYAQHGVIQNNAQCAVIRDRMHAILSAFKTENYLNSHALSVSIYEIMIHLLPIEETISQSRPNKAVAVAIEFMKYNLGNAVELADIADAAHVSKFHFARIFKEQTGYTPIAYLQKLRLDAAKYLLSTTQKTVKEIAYSVGYQSEMGFILAFTEKIGVTPGRFRDFSL